MAVDRNIVSTDFMVTLVAVLSPEAEVDHDPGTGTSKRGRELGRLRFVLVLACFVKHEPICEVSIRLSIRSRMGWKR